jgi:hypothetical protein
MQDVEDLKGDVVWYTKPVLRLGNMGEGIRASVFSELIAFKGNISSLYFDREMSEKKHNKLRISRSGMNAVMLKDFGGVENFEWNPDASIPNEVKEGNVLVKIRACSFNHFDVGMREGIACYFEANNAKGSLGGECPMILGMDFSGVVEDIGLGVTSVKIEDEVYGLALPAYAV